MSSNVVNQVAFLRTSREFPTDQGKLMQTLDKSYIDTSNAVNARTIGIFPTNRPAITGENWFLTGNQKQQALRQVYMFTTTADIPLGFKISTIAEFTRLFGTWLSGTSWFGLIAGSSVAIAGQLSFYLVVDGASTTTDLIRFASGAGVPALTSGKVVIEWISFV